MNKIAMLHCMSSFDYFKQIECANVIESTIEYLVKELYNNSDEKYRCEHCALNQNGCKAEYKVPEQCKLGMKNYVFLKMGAIEPSPVKDIIKVLQTFEEINKTKDNY